MDTFDFFLSDIIEESDIQEDKMLKSEKQKIKNLYHKQKVVQKQKEKKKKFKEQKFQLIQVMQTQEEKNNFVHSFKVKREEKRENGLKSLQSPYRVIIDCGFELNMSEKEQRSLARQMSELYTENRKLQQPLKIHITNIYPILDEFLTQYNYKHWSIVSDVRVFTDMEDFKDANIVYLSPDGEEELKEIREDEVYVIGGLVDRVIMKYATLNRSKQLGVRCARLPIGQFIKKSYKKCLNVSTAALMIASYLELKDWEKAFESIVPQKFKEL